PQIHSRVSIRFGRSAHDFGPLDVWARESGLRRMLVEEKAIAGLVVHAVQHSPEIKLGIGVVRLEGNRNARKRVAEADWPETGDGAILGAADKDRIDARGPILRGHRRTTAQEVDLDEMGWAAQDVGTLGEVAATVLTRTLVRGA